MLSFGLNSTNGLMASLLHLFNHALMKGALFLALAAVVFRTGSSQIEHFSGLAKQMPWTMAAMVISCMSLVGMPLTVGFISKWYMLTASIESGWWLLAGIILLGSLLSIIYVWRIIETAYFQPVQASNVQAKEAPLSLLMPVWILTLANIYFGIDSRLTVSVSHAAIQSLVGGM